AGALEARGGIGAGFASAVGGAGGWGAAGAGEPRPTERPNRRHCPATGANSISKMNCDGTEGKKPGICNKPLDSICGNKVSCGSMTGEPDRSKLSLRSLAKISASRAAELTWKPGAPRSRSTV